MRDGRLRRQWRDRTRSLAVVSAKREYSRTWQETFAGFSLDICKPGVQRRSRLREKPVFPAHFCVFQKPWSEAAMHGWGGRDRTSERSEERRVGKESRS